MKILGWRSACFPTPIIKSTIALSKKISVEDITDGKAQLDVSSCTTCTLGGGLNEVKCLSMLESLVYNVISDDARNELMMNMFNNSVRDYCTVRGVVLWVHSWLVQASIVLYKDGSSDCSHGRSHDKEQSFNDHNLNTTKLQSLIFETSGPPGCSSRFQRCI